MLEVRLVVQGWLPLNFLDIQARTHAPLHTNSRAAQVIFATSVFVVTLRTVTTILSDQLTHDQNAAVAVDIGAIGDAEDVLPVGKLVISREEDWEVAQSILVLWFEPPVLSSQSFMQIKAHTHVLMISLTWCIGP